MIFSADVESEIKCTLKRVHLVEKNGNRITITVLFWQGHKDLNPEPTVLETAALPIELYPYI